MRGALGGPRVLLRRLREVMAEPVSAQERLDKIVVLIAANMVAEVCSVYVLRVDGTLELYATEGLNREAVHHTVLRADEGLVGLVASEANADQPVGRAGPSGLLVPAGDRRRNLPLLPRRAGPARRQHARRAGGAEPRAAHLFRGRSRGAADHRDGARGDDRLRRAFRARPARAPSRPRGGRCTSPAPRSPTASRSATSCCTSRASSSPISSPTTCRRSCKRLEAAIETLRADLDVLLERGDVADGGEHRDVLEAYRMFAYDRGWVHKLDEAVMTGLTAEAAVERVQSDTRARMLRADRSVSARAAARSRRPREPADAPAARPAITRPSREQLPENAILVARSMGPAALLDYDRKRLRGLVLEEGGPTLPRRHRRARARHCRRSARSTTPPASPIPATPSSSTARPATCMCGRSPDMEAAYVERVRLRARRQQQYQALRDKPCVTRDGEQVTLMINAGLPSTCRISRRPAPPASACSAPNCSSWWRRAFRAPAEQFALYRAVLDAAGGKPVTFRTLDIGGDKVLPYMRNVEEENPALGWRAIRLGLDRPGLLRSADPRAAARRRRPRAEASCFR